MSPISTRAWRGRVGNAWLAQRCRALWTELYHPEHPALSVTGVLKQEQPQMMPMPTPIDGYVEKPARVSSTCLVSVSRNRYPVPCEFAGQMVSARLYPARVCIARLNAIPVPASVETSLHLKEAPVANIGRYDSLRATGADLAEVNHV